MGRRPKDLFGEIASVHAEMQRMLEDMLRPPGRRPLVPGRGWQPATDVYRTPTHVVVRMEIAGIRMEHLKVEFDQGHLVVRGVRMEDPEESKESYHQLEIGYGPFDRAVQIPEAVDPAGMETDYRDGFLLIRLPLRRGSSRSIPIK
jgi:HSP20 family molecular chaperone IbpA